MQARDMLGNFAFGRPSCSRFWNCSQRAVSHQNGEGRHEQDPLPAACDAGENKTKEMSTRPNRVFPKQLSDSKLKGAASGKMSRKRTPRSIALSVQ